MAAGGCRRGLEELVGIAREAILAAELTAAKWIDGVGVLEAALGDGLVQDGAGADGAEIDEVTVVGVSGLGGKASDAEQARAGVLVQDGKKGAW
jgi:hypothetical protein